MVEEPMPEVYLINVSWFSNQVEYGNLLKFIISIPHSFLVESMYTHSKCSTRYVFKGFIGYLGAHYMSYIRQNQG